MRNLFIDILDIVIYILMLIPSLIYKLILRIKGKKLWLICEDFNTARDNGYHLFKYIRENHPEDNVYYVIERNCKDYNKVSKLGNVIQYRSLKHWLYYMSSNLNMSINESGNPSPHIFHFLQVYLRLYNNRIFLQHGITYNDSEKLYYKNTKFKLFVCGAKEEYEYVKKQFNYPDDKVAYLGFPRFDNLYNNEINNKQILIMPTWRKVGKQDIKDTIYYKRWISLLKNRELIKFIEKQNIIIYFYPHRDMQNYLKHFKVNSNNIKVVGEEENLQDLLKESALLITDYSSVFMDFAYMNKPVIYYQFDIDDFRKTQFKEGYFKYSKNAFGRILKDEDDVVTKIITYFEMDYRLEQMYQKRIDKFFVLRDQNNSKRVYQCLKDL